MLLKIKWKQVQLGFEATADIVVIREILVLCENNEIVEQKENAFQKNIFQILEEEDPALLYFIKKQK